MHDYPFSLHGYDDDEKPLRASPDGRTRSGRLLRDTRNHILAEFPHADQLRLREATTISIAIAKLESDVLNADAKAIASLARLSNRLAGLRRELTSAAKHKEHVDAA